MFFQKILQWIREVLNKMISQSSVKTALSVDVAISPYMADALQKWSLMYINQAPWLNDYVKSLNLPAAIASEISRSTTIEMEVEVSGSPRADFIQAQMKKVVDNLRIYTEYGVAKGGLVIKPYISNGQIAVDFVQADQFYPVTFDANGNMTACVFSDTKIIGKDFYTRLEYHSMIGTQYSIVNSAFRSATRDVLGSPVPLASVEAWANLEPQATITGITSPLFAYFKYPMANNIDPTSPLGVSAYARAVDLIEQADKIWSDLIWEFESGKRNIYVDTLAFGKDKENKPVLPDRRLYRAVDAGGNIGDGKKLFEAYSPEFREASIISGLDTILKKIEFNCGLAYGTISDPDIIANTATEIKSQKQRSYATIVDTQKSIEETLEKLIYAMDVWVTLGNLAPRGTYQTVFYFDDSIVADHDTQFAQDSQALGLGTMGKVEWRMRNYGETEEIAREKIAMIAKEQQPVDFFPTGA